MSESFDSEELFTIYTRTGVEENLKRLILAIIADIGDLDVLIPYKILYRKAGKGKWRKRLLRFFDSYLFIRSGNPEKLFFDLKSVPKLSKLMHDGEFSFVPLEEQERNFVSLLCSVGVREIMHEQKGIDKLILPVSQLDLIPAAEAGEGDIIIRRSSDEKVLKVISGPLLKLAPYVDKVDFHNRRVSLDINWLGEHRLNVGFKLPQDAEV